MDSSRPDCARPSSSRNHATCIMQHAACNVHHEHTVPGRHPLHRVHFCDWRAHSLAAAHRCANGVLSGKPYLRQTRGCVALVASAFQVRLHGWCTGTRRRIAVHRSYGHCPPSGRCGGGTGATQSKTRHKPCRGLRTYRKYRGTVSHESTLNLSLICSLGRHRRHAIEPVWSVAIHVCIVASCTEARNALS